MIIGVTGNFGSGKDSVAEILEKMNFSHFSLSDILREELKKIKKEVTRDNLRWIGNGLRSQYGPQILAQRTLEKVQEGKNYVISSIRNPTEAKILQERKDFLLINVVAPEKVRLQRLVFRDREEDPKTLAELRDKENKERSTDPNHQQLQTVMKMAKVTVTNNSTLDALEKKIRQLVQDWKIKLREKRPTWDEYFIRISQEVAKRATCDRGKSGCVIVRDKRILCTGYVGSAEGQPHCDDEGHQLKTVLNDDGTSSQHCVRTIHAEQNAICQAAREGISLKGATLYCKMEPCAVCAKMIINCGIKRVICEKRYHAAQETRELFQRTKIELEVIHDEVEQYSNQ